MIESLQDYQLSTIRFLFWKSSANKESTQALPNSVSEASPIKWEAALPSAHCAQKRWAWESKLPKMKVLMVWLLPFYKEGLNSCI